MKKKLLTLLIGFIALNSFSQQIKFSAESLKYFQYVNMAELAICNSNYKRAIVCYDSAMILEKNPGYSDLYNLALCYKREGNIKKADSLFTFLLAKGWGKENVCSCYDTLKNPIPKKDLIQVDGRYLDEILQNILKDDQKANGIQYQKMEFYVQTVIENAKKIMALEQEDHELMLHDTKGLLFIPLTHFFQLWGINDRIKKDSTFTKRFIALKPIGDFNFEEAHLLEFLKEQVSKGYFNRNVFASFLSSRGYNFGLAVFQKNDKITINSPENLGQDKLIGIDSTRKSMGLESYKDYFKKARYQDSILTAGKPFTSIKYKKYVEMIEEMSNSCSFQIIKQYRIMMQMAH